MATAEELLRSVDNVLTIDSDLRTISIPSSVTILGVESDDDVRRLHFSMPSTYGDLDLSDFDIRVNYLNANHEGDVYAVTDAVADASTGVITFSWLVGRTATSHKGNVRFIVCLKRSKNGEVVQEFNTTVASLPVLEGLETAEAVVQEHPDILENILVRLDDLEQTGGVSDEQIGNAVNAYLAENPVEAGATAEQAAQIQKNTEDIKELKQNGTGNTVTGKLIDYISSTGSMESGAPNYVAFNYTDGTHDTFTVYNGEKGEPGDDYILTEADKQEIAGMVEVTGGSGSGAGIDDTTPSVNTTYSSNKIDALLNEQKEANEKQDTEIEALKQSGGVTDEQVQTAVNNYLTENPVSGALTANEKTLMLALFKSAEYTSNVKAVVAQLEAIWTGGSTITYSVTNNLTNVSTDNDASTTAGGMDYTATLTADEGYTLSEVTVTMDGEDVTADAYAEGVINIASVLGDIVITATAAEQVSLEPVYALSEPLVFDGSTMKEIDTGYSFYRSDGADMSFSVCVDFQNISGYSTLFWTGTDENEYNQTSLLGICKTSYWITMFVLGKTPGNIWSDSSKRYRVIMSHEADSADATLHVWVEGESEYKTYTITDVTKKITSQNVNVILGGFYTNNQTYQTATMYDFKIYERALSVDEVKAFMGVA